MAAQQQMQPCEDKEGEWEEGSETVVVVAATKTKLTHGVREGGPDTLERKQQRGNTDHCMRSDED